MARDRCCFTVPFDVPVAVALSQWIGVGGCGWPISCKMTCIFFASCAFGNGALSYASAADAAVSFNEVHKEQIAPFNFIACPFFGAELMKLCPPAVLFAPGSFMCDASE